MHFADRLNAAIKRVGTPICVGIDPRPEDLPPGFLDRFPGDRPGVAEALRVFGCGVVDVVAPLVPAVKFQAAFYEAYGPEGVAALHATARYAQGKGLHRPDRRQAERHRLDGRGVCPGLSRQGARGRELRALLGRRRADGQPLPRERRHRPVRQGGRTRGEGALRPRPDEQRLGRRVPGPGRRREGRSTGTWPSGWPNGPSRTGARRATACSGRWSGATYPEQLAELRAALPGVPFLVPGYGTQGGSARDVAPAFDADGLGAIVNNSRGLTFAYSRPAARAKFGDDWQAAIEEAVREMIDDLAANTNAGKLRTRPAE